MAFVGILHNVIHTKKPDPGDEKSPEYPKITGCPESRCENPEVQKYHILGNPVGIPKIPNHGVLNPEVQKIPNLRDLKKPRDKFIVPNAYSGYSLKSSSLKLCFPSLEIFFKIKKLILRHERPFEVENLRNSKQHWKIPWPFSK